MAVKGFSIIIHRSKGGKWLKYFGSYVKGIFSDNNALLNPAEKTGWGIKFDIVIGGLVFPFDYLWKKEAHTEIPRIYDIPLPEWDRVFGKKLSDRLRDKLPEGVNPKDVHDFKFGVYNAWKGKYVFRINIPWMIMPFIAIGTPIKNFYFGAKTYEVTVDKPNGFIQADQGDWTWAQGIKPGRYICPSSSIRSKRK